MKTYLAARIIAGLIAAPLRFFFPTLDHTIRSLTLLALVQAIT